MKTFEIVTLLVVSVIGYQAFTLGLALKRGSRLAEASEPFQQRLSEPRSRLLVIGDSTAVGTGADTPAGSVAGRLAERIDGLEVVNLARDGARFGDLPGQLQQAELDRFDAVLIQAGGNDILRFTDLEKLETAVARTLDLARRISDRVFMLSTGDVGIAPAFAPPLDWILSARTRSVRRLLLDIAARTDIEYLDLYRDQAEDPFAKSPDALYATDGLHPSAAGYALWYRELVEKTAILEALQAPGDEAAPADPP